MVAVHGFALITVDTRPGSLVLRGEKSWCHKRVTRPLQSTLLPNQKIFKKREQTLPVRSCVSSWSESAVQIRSSGDEKAPAKILFAAGGTGGHVYPAIAIADEITKTDPAARVLFAGTKTRMEWTAVPEAGYPIFPIEAVSLKRPLASIQNLFLPFKILVSLASAWQLLRKLQPDVVVGTGGYVAGPTCLMAAMLGIPVVIQEQNAYAGVTNRLLGLVAVVVFVAFEAAKTYFPKHKTVLKGNPVRSSLSKGMPKSEALSLLIESIHHSQNSVELVDSTEAKGKNPKFSASHEPYRALLVLGGSLGAGPINDAMVQCSMCLLERSPDLLIVWQTGSRFFSQVASKVPQHKRLILTPFIQRMDLAYAAADLVMGRSGAITCSELLLTGTPSILVPSPNVTADHQAKNAKAMVDVGAAVLLSEDKLSGDKVESTIMSLLGNQALLSMMKEKACKACTPTATKDIGMHVLSLARKKHK